MANPYNELPAPPEKVSAATVLQRLIDALGFRYRVATEALNADDITHRPVPSSMNIEEVNMHIFHLVSRSSKSLQNESEVTYKTQTFAEARGSILGILEELSAYLAQLSDEELGTKTVYLKRMDQSFPFWYLINGYISDALTHVGQINSWRRMSGNPVPKISPFTGQPL